MTKPSCRHCGASLPAALPADGVCPHCGAVLDVRGTVADAAASDRTIDLPGGPLDEDASFSVGDVHHARTVDPLPHDATVDFGPGGVTPGELGATFDPPTAEPRDMPPQSETVDIVADSPAPDLSDSAATIDPGPGTVYPLPHNATVDFGPNAPAGGDAAALDASFDLVKPGTVFPLPNAVTVEPSTGSGSGGVGGSSFGGSGSGDAATFDSDVGGLDLDAQLSQVWGDDVDEQAPPRYTIKGKPRDSRRNDQTLVVNTRAVRETKRVLPGSGQLDYELLDMLGQGGMGVVYAARQASIDRTVALKMLKPKLGGNRDSQQKFLSEAVVTGDLDHPNIVPIYDLGKNESGDLFYAMKKVEGTPWSKAIFNRTRQENIEILLKSCDAVAFAHARGVVHRDLKPENIMLGEFGEVLVMDWGLAYSTPQFRKSASITHTHSMGGSPAYMAPEMATGPIERITAASDVYLLGAILYEIITGKPPHTGSNVSQCLMAAARNDIVPTEVTGELVDIALHAMATNPLDRYASVRDFQTAIRGYLAHSESIALASQAHADLAAARESKAYQTFARAVFGFEQALGLWEGNAEAVAGVRAAKTAYAECAFAKEDYDLAAGLLDRKLPDQGALADKIDAARRERDARQARLRNAKRFVASLIVGIFVVGTVAFFGIRMQRDRAIVAEAAAMRDRDLAEQAEAQAMQDRDLAQKAETQARSDRDLAVKAEAQAKQDRDLAEQAKEAEEYAAYAARIGLAAARIDENAFDGAAELLDTCPADLRNWEWGRLKFLCDRSRLTIEAGAPITAVALDAAGERCAAGGWNGTLGIWNVADGRRLLEVPYDGAFVNAVAFSPDGRLLAAGGSDRDHFAALYDAADGKLVRTFTGHTDAVLSIAFDRAGKRLLTASYDGTTRLWDVATGKTLRSWHGHASAVTAAAFAPDGKSIVTTGQDGTACVWSLEAAPAVAAATEADAAPPAEIRAFLGHRGPVQGVAFAPDGRTVATAGDDRRVLVWQPADVRPYRLTEVFAEKPPAPPESRELVGHRAAVACTAFAPDGRRLVSGGLDNALIVWDAATGNAVKTLRGHGGQVRACAFSPDGKLVLSGAHDGTLRLWDVDEYAETQTVRPIALVGHADAVLAADFAPDEQTIVTAGRDRTAKLWNAATREPLATLSEGHDYLASAAVIASGGKHLVTAAVDGTTRVWSTADGVEVVAVRDTGRNACLAASPDGGLIATAAGDKGVKLWDPATGQVVRTLPPHRTELTALAFSPDGKLLFAGESSGRANVWRVADGSSVWSELHHSRKITAAAFTADGRQLLTASLDNTVGRWNVADGVELTTLVWKHPAGVVGLATCGADRAATVCEDGVVRLWNLADGASTSDASQPVALPLPPGDYAAAASSSDGRMLAVVDRTRGTVRLWDVAAEREVPPPQAVADAAPWLDLSAGAALWTVAFAPNGESLVTVGGNEAQQWTVADAAPRQSFRPHGAVAGVAYSPDGRFVATAGWDGAVKIWDVAERRAVRKLAAAHDGIVNSVVYDRTGRRLLTAGDDGLARLWDAETGEPLSVFKGHTDRVLHAAFDAEGKRIVTASADKTARVWNAADGTLLHELEGHAWAVLAAAFDDSGKRVVTAGADDTAMIWDAADGRRLFALTGHTAPVTGASFSPDGLRIVTASRDGNVKVWDASAAKELLTLRGHTDEVTVAKFSPTGRTILSTSRDGGVILWPTVPWK